MYQRLNSCSRVESVGGSPADALFDLLVEERMAVLCVMDEGDDRLSTFRGEPKAPPGDAEAMRARQQSIAQREAIKAGQFARAHRAGAYKDHILSFVGS